MNKSTLARAVLQLLIVGSIVTFLGSCENVGNQHAVALEKAPERLGNLESACRHSYWCAYIKGPIWAKNVYVSEEGRFSKVGIGIQKGHDLENALEVNGTILAEEILVEANVADYVFTPGYELQSLEFVEDFINAHHHLPGIPSESDVAAAGGRVGVGDSYRSLLEKIEELTLYSIQQEKRIQALEYLVTHNHKAK